MGEVHQLITTHGLEEAKARAADKLDRQCVETAFAVMSDEEQRIGIMHAGFSMTALPHKEIAEPVCTRRGGPIKLRIDSGTDEDGLPVGIPFGSIARVILLYLQTEAVKTRSREVELGRSMNQWLSSMNIDGGGRQYRLVREQSRRLSLCRLTFYRTTDETTRITNSSFVRDAILPSRGSNQITLWREVVRLDEGFYESLIAHPMPVLESAIKQIGSRSMAIDVYVWLACRLHHLKRSMPVPWRALYEQFGGGYSQFRQFKAKLKEPMALALAAYREARVSVDDNGVTLYPSASPVQSRKLASIL